MRTIHTDEIIKNIKEMCIEANLSLTEDMKCRFKNATESEKSPLLLPPSLHAPISKTAN